ncbi:MAG: epoxide hydrolase family protein [Ktedonobacterales bacterium]
MEIQPFTISIADEILDDLVERIERTRWPKQRFGATWEQGTDPDYLQELLAYWVGTFDWRAQERRLNGYRQFHAEIDGIQIHFVHERAAGSGGIPLILTHGWPSTFVELLPLVPLLTNPRAHGIDGSAFDVVIPSLPGYGFSERPSRTGVTTRYTAGLWHRLMAGLGYQRYGAQGGDFGSAVATFMALEHPQPMIGLHLSNLDLLPYLGPDSRPLSPPERAYLEEYRRWADLDGGYRAIQSTRPQTLSYGLNDSPAGLAAWIVEKFRAWSDSGGAIERRFSKDDLLTTTTMYWVTETICTSIRDYFDNRWHAIPLERTDFVGVPTAIAVFAHQFVHDGTPTREWAERLYNVVQWSVMPSGGHFASMEEPELLARDIAAFFADR